MLRSLTKCILLILCSWLLVGPQFFLQIGAWSWMLVSYAQESSLEIALQQTFSGERPCGMCEVIQATEQKDASFPVRVQAAADDLRLVLPSTQRLQLGAAPAKSAPVLFKPLAPPSPTFGVPTPPPRLSA